uniref:Fibroblast growth factor n=1 Tax=Anas platyrhynchos TaxID=8839 RepID=A0A8B9T4C0_ANAPL
MLGIGKGGLLGAGHGQCQRGCSWGRGAQLRAPRGCCPAPGSGGEGRGGARRERLPGGAQAGRSAPAPSSSSSSSTSSSSSSSSWAAGPSRFPRSRPGRRRGRLYCRVGIGFHLQLHPDGRVDGAHDASPLSILEIFAVSQGIVGIRGVFSNKFLAMSKKGKLHASGRTMLYTDESCQFVET